MCINYQIDFKLMHSIILCLNGQKQMPSLKDTSIASLQSGYIGQPGGLPIAF